MEEQIKELRIKELMELYGFDKEEAIILFGEIFDGEEETSSDSSNNQK